MDQLYDKRYLVYCKAMMPLTLHAIDALTNLPVGGA
jgi:hypothetical protein